MTNPPDESRTAFEHFSNEYAQALQAYAAIEQQAALLLLGGHSDELRRFIDQFLEMARRTEGEAVEKGEAHFAEWFRELIDKAEKLRAGVPT